MASIWTGLAFMHGHIADPGLARRLAALPPGGGRRRASPRAVLPMPAVAAFGASFRHSLKGGFDRVTSPPRRFVPGWLQRALGTPEKHRPGSCAAGPMGGGC